MLSYFGAWRILAWSSAMRAFRDSVIARTLASSTSLSIMSCSNSISAGDLFGVGALEA